jgi:hypothetical protein
MNPEIDTETLIDITNSIIGTLDPIESKVIVMRFGLMNSEELSVPQIAENLQISNSEVEKIISRALRNLRHPSRTRSLSALFPDIKKAAQTLSYIQEANLPFEEAKQIIQTELPSFFPAVERLAKSNDGLIKLISIILPIILFAASFLLKGESTVNIQQNTTVVIENHYNEPQTKPSPSAKSKPKKARKRNKAKKGCE